MAPVRCRAPAAGQGPRRPRAGRAGARRRGAPSRTSSRPRRGAAYSRVDLVERRGEFAVRGGIVDVFPPTEEHPLRRGVLGRRRRGDPLRSRSPTSARWRPSTAAVGAAVPRAAAHRRRYADAQPSSAEPHPQLAEHHRQDRRTASRSRAWSRWPRSSSTSMETAASTCCRRTHVLVARPRAGPHPRPRPGRDERGVPRAGWAAAAGGTPPRSTSARCWAPPRSRTIAELRQQARELGVRWLDLTPFAGDGEDDTLDLGITVSPTFRGSTEDAVAELRRLVADDWAVLVATEGHGLAKRVVEVLAEHDVAARLDPEDADAEPGVVTVTTAPSATGSWSRRAGSPSSPRRPHRGGRRVGHVDQGHAADAVRAATRSTRSSCGRRLRRPRAARRRAASSR